MSQDFPTFNEAAGQDDVRTGLLNQRTRTDALRGMFSGTAFPSSPVLGQHCYRTDQSKEYVCTATTPSVVWSEFRIGTVSIAQGGTGATDAAGARTALGLGTAATATLGTGSYQIPNVSQNDSKYIQKSNNGNDFSNIPATRANLGLGSAALRADTDFLASGDVVSVRQIPQQIKNVDYNLILSDGGKHILHPSADTSARTITIPDNATVAFPIGTAITLVNQNGAGDLTIAIAGTDVLRLAGAGTTGNRTLLANGMATILKITATDWIISGIGLI